VVLDGVAPVLSNVIFNNPNASYWVLQGAGTTGLTLTGTDGSAPAAVTVISGTHWVDTPIFLDSNLIVSSSGSLMMSGGVSDRGLAETLTLDGGGELILAGTDSYTGGTVVNAGTLVLDSNTAIAKGTSLTVGDGATSIFGASAAASLAASGPAVSPAPEPGTLILVSVGAIGLLACTWRRRLFRTPADRSRTARRQD
jgi:autotransporter-associated beta strand protein